MATKRHRVGKGKRRRGHRSHSLTSIHNLILKAIDSAARKGRDWKADRRVQLLLREQRRLRVRQAENAPW